MSEENEEKVFNHTGHKALWDFLVRNPSAHKEDWEGWIDYDEGEAEVNCHCFACIYVGFDTGSCLNCPLKWENNKDCFSAIGLYNTWHQETDLLKKTRLAAKIRDLPVREGVECE